MIQSIGFLEFNSIARGIEAVDKMLKAAEVNLLFSRPNCPGKYNVLISGDVSPIKTSMAVGVKIAKHNVVDRLEIPWVHPQVIKAINSTTFPEEFDTIGVLEYFSITSSIIGADSAVKAADVTLLDIRLGTGIGGKSFVILSGDTAAVDEAVENGVKATSESGMLVNKAVIPNLKKELFYNLL